MPAYIKTKWVDGENKYSITDQVGNVIPEFEDIKMLYTGTGGTPLSAEKMNHIEQGILDRESSIINMWFGNGFDGTATITGATTLTRDMYYDDLAINNGAILYTRGFKVFVRGTLTNNGIIDNSGGNGANGGTTYNPGGVSYGGGAGGPGYNGSSSLGGSGSIGGNGGLGGGYYYNTAPIINNNTAKTALAWGLTNELAIALLEGFHGFNTGGGAGGNGGYSSQTSYSGGTLYGGSGGGGGGRIIICASAIANNGAIKSNGGNGGNNGFSASNYCSGAGGGGGGGFVFLACRSFTGNNPVVNGGIAGINTSGHTELNATAGATGQYKLLQIG